MRLAGYRKVTRCSYASGDELDVLSVGQVSAPSRESPGLVFAPVLLQFKEPQKQVSQGGHDLRTAAAADSASVLAQADIPAIVRTVFTAGPVIADDCQQLLGAVLPGSGAGAVEAVFFGLLGDLTLAQLLALPPHGDKLPTPTQAGLLGAQTDSLEAPAYQAAMLFAPAGVVFRGKKNLWAA